MPFLKTIDFSSFNTGSAVPSLNRNHIHELNINIPSVTEQKAIAAVLSSLDDKIDLLHRQNKTLEAMLKRFLNSGLWLRRGRIGRKSRFHFLVILFAEKHHQKAMLVILMEMYRL
jgi:type I restriction enzyme S subunit